MSNTTPRTGWPPGLLQDDDRRLSRWLSGRACLICWRCAAKEPRNG